MKRRSKRLAALVIVGAIAVTTLVLWQQSSHRRAASQSARPVEPAMPVRARKSLEPELATSLASGAVAFDADPVGNLRLEGQVLAEDGGGAFGAVVTMNSNPPRSATTAEDGTFLFEHVVARRYTLAARTDAQVGGPVVHELTSASDPVVIRLHEGVRVVVAVVSADDGTPIARATVDMLSWQSPRSGTTDTAGNATIAGITSGEVVVQAAAQGYATARQPLIVPAASAGSVHTTVALHRGAAVSGTVVDAAGRPVVGAAVFAQNVAADPGRGLDRGEQVDTDQAGRFAISTVAAGTYRFVAERAGYPRAVSELYVTDGKSPLSSVQIVLREGASLSGRVVTRTGERASWATVRIGVSGPAGGDDGSATRVATADDHGAFEVSGLPASPVVVMAEHDGGSSELREVDLGVRQAVVGLVLTVDIDGTIAGSVVTSSGEPVAEVQVTAVPDAWAGAPGAGVAVRGLASQVTDGAGAFVLEGLPDGVYRVRASRAGLSLRTLLQPGVSAKTGDTQVRVVLDGDGSLEGRVAFDTGEAVPVFMITVGVPPPSAFADDEGVFSLPSVPAGSYDIVVRGPNFAARTLRDVSVASGETVDLGTVVVARGRSVSGRVVDKAGSGVAGAQVAVGRELVGTGDSLTTGDGSGGDVRRTQTDARGMFSLDGIGTGSQAIAASHPEHGRSLALGVPAGRASAEVELQLRPLGSIAGKVTAAGKPVARARVMATSAGVYAQHVEVTTGPNGGYVIGQLPEGEHNITAMIDTGFGATTGRVGAVVTGGETTRDVDIELAVGTVTLTAYVEGVNGATIDGALVFLCGGSVRADNLAQLRQLLLSNANARLQFAMGGSARFVDIAPGAYSVCVAPVNGDLDDAKFQQRLERHEDLLATYCQPQEVAPTPDAQRVTTTVPPMKPLPESDAE